MSVALKSWLNSKRNAAANGSLMRTHPLGVMCLGKSPNETFDIAAKMSQTTHADPRCTVSCCAVTALVRGILRGEIRLKRDLDRVLVEAYEFVREREDLRNPGYNLDAASPLSDDEDRALLDIEEYKKHIEVESFADLQLDDARKMGYVYKCLGAAVFALRMAMRDEASEFLTEFEGKNRFQEIIVALIMEGGDADTNGCVAGALLGAWYGYSRLPGSWRSGIQHRDWLLRKCQALSWQVGVDKRHDRREEGAVDEDTRPDGGRGLFTEKELNDRERALVEKILLKDKARRDTEIKEKVKGKGLTGWVKSLTLST